MNFMDTEPILLHWTEGGTGLTNFSPKDEWIYNKAIKVHGNPNYVVVQSPCRATCTIRSDYSLHKLDIQENREDCGPFWETHRSIDPEWIKLQKSAVASES